ncbi:type VI secretion system secreted protein VgrG, partial [Pseudoduganella namucuonensis]
FSEGGIELGTTGDFVAHAAKHSLPGPKNVAVSMAMPELSDPKGEGALNLGSHPTAGGRAFGGAPYKLFKDDVLLEQGQFDEEGNLVFTHDLEAQAAYKLELANGQRYAIDPDEQVEQSRISAAIGFHGYQNAGGYLNDDAMSLDEDRLACNPAACGKKRAS